MITLRSRRIIRKLHSWKLHLHCLVAVLLALGFGTATANRADAQAPPTTLAVVDQWNALDGVTTTTNPQALLMKGTLWYDSFDDTIVYRYWHRQPNTFPLTFAVQSRTTDGDLVKNLESTDITGWNKGLAVDPLTGNYLLGGFRNGGIVLDRDTGLKIGDMQAHPRDTSYDNLATDLVGNVYIVPQTTGVLLKFDNSSNNFNFIYASGTGTVTAGLVRNPDGTVPRDPSSGFPIGVDPDYPDWMALGLAPGVVIKHEVCTRGAGAPFGTYFSPFHPGVAFLFPATNAHQMAEANCHQRKRAGSTINCFANVQAEPLNENVCYRWPSNSSGSGGQIQSHNGAPIATDSIGNVYLIGSETGVVSKFGPDGTFLKSFGYGVVDWQDVWQVCTAADNSPWNGYLPHQAVNSCISNGRRGISAMAVDSENRLYMCTSRDGGTVPIIRVTDTEGNILADAVVDPNSSSPALPNQPCSDIALDSVGNIFVSWGHLADTQNPNSLSNVYRLEALFASNEPPTAAAGDDQSIRAGDTVFLDGSASFDDNTAPQDLVYAWSFSSLPEGSTAILTGDDTATPSFAADVAGTYVVELVVEDEGGLSSAPDQVEVSSDNLAPTAAAGDDVLVILGEGVVLDGSASTDPEMDSLTFAWTITSAPAGSTATIADPGMEMASLTPDLEGLYVVTLVVSDSIGAGAPDTTVVTAATAEEFAEIQITSGYDVVESLTAGEVTNGGNQNAFLNFLTQAIVALQADPPDVAEAINKLEKALARTDGCVLRGSPDGNGAGRDWITDCAAQTEVYDLLNAALAGLTP